MVMNIKFNYLHRDAGNYKVFGSVVFSNPDNLIISEIDSIVNHNLIEWLYFLPNECNIPRLAFPEFIEEMDHPWNEYESVELTDEEPTDDRTIQNFLLEFSQKKPLY
jgi:hypothetical protein